MSTAVVEPCPPHLLGEEKPEYGGHLFFHLEEGRAGCPHCGWSGVPTFNGGDVPAVRVDEHGEYRVPADGDRPAVISTWCPSCQASVEADVEQFKLDIRPRRAPRNQPCPCGSGVKAKRCDCAEYTT